MVYMYVYSPVSYSTTTNWIFSSSQPHKQEDPCDKKCILCIQTHDDGGWILCVFISVWPGWSQTQIVLCLPTSECVNYPCFHMCQYWMWEKLNTCRKNVGRVSHQTLRATLTHVCLQCNPSAAKYALRCTSKHTSLHFKGYFSTKYIILLPYALQVWPVHMKYCCIGSCHGQMLVETETDSYLKSYEAYSFL